MSQDRTRARCVPRLAAADRQRDRLGALCRRLRQPLARRGAGLAQRQRCELCTRHRARPSRHHRRNDFGILRQARPGAGTRPRRSTSRSTTARSRRWTISRCSVARTPRRSRMKTGEWEVLQFASATLLAAQPVALEPALLRGPGRHRKRDARSGRERRARGAARRRAAAACASAERIRAAVQLSLGTARQEHFRSRLIRVLCCNSRASGCARCRRCVCQRTGRRAAICCLPGSAARASAGDSWDQTEVPLAEESEAYDVEILDGSGDVVRTFSSRRPLR